MALQNLLSSWKAHRRLHDMIKIDILLPQDIYTPGSLVEGMVVLQSATAAAFSSLDFACTWTDPGDNSTVGQQSGQLLRTGQLVAGEERRIPFAVQLPEQASSKVRLDDLHWELRAELRWDADENPVCTKTFEVALRRAREEKLARKLMGGKDVSDGKKSGAARPAPTTAGDVVGGLFISTFFVALLIGGGTLVFNGYPDRVLPEFVPWFGVVCLLGGLFVIQKIWEGLYPAFGRGLMAVLTGGLALLGVFGAVVAPGFSILQGAQAGWTYSGIDHLGSTFGQMAWIMAVIGGVWFGYALSTRRDREPAVLTAILLLGIVAVGLLAGVLQAPTGLHFAEGNYIAGGLGAVSLIVMATMREWRRPSARFALLVMVVPLLLAGGLVRAGGAPAYGAAGLIVALLAAYAFFTLRSLAAEARIGTPTLRLLPTQVHPGGVLRLEIDFLPRKNTTIRDIRATLICTYSYSGADPDDNDSEEVSRQALKGMFPVELVAGQAKTVALSGVLALDADPSSTGSSSYRWELQVVIDVGDGPDWEDILPVEVVG